jgi:prenyltransferase beta subunit
MTQPLSKTCNELILDYLIRTRSLLSDDAQNHIISFIQSQKSPSGGFLDRSGKTDLYYSVFGYTLSLVFDIKLDINREKEYLSKLKEEEKPDFVHTICYLRADFLLNVIKWRQKSGLSAKKLMSFNFAKDLFAKELIKKTIADNKAYLEELKAHQAGDLGFNHNKKTSAVSTVYANYLMWTLYQDLQWDANHIAGILKANMNLQLANGSYANEEKSNDGVTSATAAGIIMSEYMLRESSADWLLNLMTKKGGFRAASGVPIADLLSTSTALLALKVREENLDAYAENCLNFVNLHWDESGGFFGSIADMTCDVEYTYYALLAIGILA